MLNELLHSKLTKREKQTKQISINQLTQILQAPLAHVPEWKELIPGVGDIQRKIEIGQRESLTAGYEATTKREREEEMEEEEEAAKEEEKKRRKEAAEERKEEAAQKYEEKREQQEVENPFETTEIIPETTLLTRDADQVEWLWSPTTIVENGDEQLQLIVDEFTRKTFTQSPSVATMWIIRNQAEFWMEEFFNFTLAPCEFRPELPPVQNLRVQLIVPIIKMLFAIQKAEQENQDEKYQVVFSEPLFQEWQWRQILSILFPLTAMVYYQEIPASGQGTTIFNAASQYIQSGNPNVIPLLRVVKGHCVPLLNP